MPTNKITESKIEAYAIELLEKSGYEYIYGPDIAPDSETPERESFKDVLTVLDKQDYFCVGNCSCKVKHNLDPDHENCRHHPFEENCVHFGDFARYMVENGHGRELSREECRDVLLQCAEAGLVHGVSNWATPVDTI